jgi:hypothetical protein
MDLSLIGLVFDSIRAEWRDIPPHLAPWGVWIAQHPPLPADAHPISLHLRAVQRAWLLQGDDPQPRERNVWEYLRYVVVHFERPWDTYHQAPQDPRFARTFPMGMARFAPFGESEDVYLETVWGGLWGRGRRLINTAPGVLTEARVFWVS